MHLRRLNPMLIFSNIKFKNNYLKYPGSEEQNSWDIINEYLKKDTQFMRILWIIDNKLENYGVLRR